MDKRIFAALSVTALLSACGGGGPARPGTAPLPPVSSVKPAPVPPPRPGVQVLRAPGMEGVIGANANALLRSFGDPRLDMREGDVRKLQFSGGACVLDIYLYPPANGGEEVATHVDARRGSDGQDVDRAACVNALRKR